MCHGSWTIRNGGGVPIHATITAHGHQQSVRLPAGECRGGPGTIRHLDLASCVTVGLEPSVLRRCFQNFYAALSDPGARMGLDQLIKLLQDLEDNGNEPLCIRELVDHVQDRLPMAYTHTWANGELIA